MPELKKITSYLNDILKISEFRSDASNNGLQFEGNRDVRKIVFGVDACDALFCTAADLDADMIFVHHGISWGASLKRIVSLDARRVSMLAANGMSLYAAHLPLDANPEFGHNANLAKMIGLKNPQPYGEYDGMYIGFHGKLEKPLTLKGIAKVFDKKLASEGDFGFFGDPAAKVSHLGIISGGGDYAEAFSEAYEHGIDCLVTGEMGHTAFHYAIEAGVSVITLGHYRSETPGVLSVMEKIKEKFKVETVFVDLPTNL